MGLLDFLSKDPLKKKLEQLLSSVLLLPNFPKRTRFTHAEWAGMSNQARSTSRSPHSEAIKRVKDFRDWTALVQALGKAQFAPAVPALTQLWNDCALVPVRIAAGHALRSIGTPEARKTLIDQIEDSESSYLAIVAIFEEGPQLAYDRLSVYFDPARMKEPGGTAIPEDILQVFAPSSFTYDDKKRVPRWTEPRSPQWLLADPRWLPLCTSFRRDKKLGYYTRSTLKYADPSKVRAALDQALANEGPRIIQVITQSTGDLVSRYQRGEFESVWSELRKHPAVGGDLLEEARGVASETMKRVARNVERISERLSKAGWKTGYAPLHSKPRKEDGDVFRQIEERTSAPLPLSLRAFWEEVGGVNWVWDYDEPEDCPNLGIDLPLAHLDPLCVGSPENMTHLFDEWEDQHKDVDPEIAGPFRLDLAPDRLHKANISGGAPYGIELPFHGVDPIFENEGRELPFVDYLRLCFRWAGFPMLEKHGDREDVLKWVKTLGKDLEPF